MGNRISKQGIDLIAEFEGFRPNPYKCSAGVPTIGYGSTVYLDGTKVTMRDYPITEAEARRLLELMAQKFAQQVDERIEQELTQEQFDALVSLAYNIGIGAFSRSTLLRKVNANPCDPNIIEQFKRWKYAGGKVVKGLLKRREQEANYYFQC